MYSVRVLSLFGFLAASFVLSGAHPSGRLAFGQPVDNLRQFPHHVSIFVTNYDINCGGSILNKHWVVTSAFCIRPVTESGRLDLQFRRKYNNDTNLNYFTISVNRDQVFLYPTNSDDIALIKLPITLDFTENLAPIGVSRQPIEALRGRFSVMPGFDEFYYGTTWPTTPRTTPIIYTCPPNSVMCTTTTTPSTPPTTPYTSTTIKTTTTTTTCAPTTVASTPCFGCPPLPTPAPTPGYPTNNENVYNPDRPWDYKVGNDLRYGMFTIVDSRVCKREYKTHFNEFNELCIDTWGDNPNTPCNSDKGSGLVVGWPAKSELVGLYSYKPWGDCGNRDPAIFTFIDKYMGWIESLIHS